MDYLREHVSRIYRNWKIHSEVTNFKKKIEIKEKL